MLALAKKKTNIFLLLYALVEVISPAWGGICLGLALVMALWSWYRQSKPLAQEFRGYYYAWGFFWGTMVLSSLQSGNWLQGCSLLGEYWLWRVAGFFILTLTLNHYQGAKQVFLCTWAAMALEAGLVVYQGLQGMYRPYGFQYNAMWPASMLCIFTPIFLTALLDEAFSIKYRCLAVVLFLLNSWALLYNGTRGVWLADLITCVALGLYYCWQRPKNILYCLTLALLIGGYGLSNQQYIDRFQSIGDIQADSAYCRICLWRSSTEMFLDHPLLGVGLGNYLQAYQADYMQPDVPNKELTHAHSNIFQMLAENGLVGLSGYLVLFGYILYRNYRALRGRGAVYGLMLLAATASFLLQGMTDYNFIIDTGVKYYSLLLGSLMILQRVGQRFD